MIHSFFCCSDFLPFDTSVFSFFEIYHEVDYTTIIVNCYYRHRALRCRQSHGNYMNYTHEKKKNWSNDEIEQFYSIWLQWMERPENLSGHCRSHSPLPSTLKFKWQFKAWVCSVLINVGILTSIFCLFVFVGTISRLNLNFLNNIRIFSAKKKQLLFIKCFCSKDLFDGLKEKDLWWWRFSNIEHRYISRKFTILKSFWMIHFNRFYRPNNKTSAHLKVRIDEAIHFDVVMTFCWWFQELLAVYNLCSIL